MKVKGKKITEEEIEKIEKYYLNVIARYVGADINGFINRLESHNKTWKSWFPKRGNRKSFFDIGSERVTYMLLNRGDILGEPNANPIGSDSSFLKYDDTFECYLAINIDVKSVKANTNLGDIINNMPVGINQNSYSCVIEYKSRGKITDRKLYSPGLENYYKIKDHHGIHRDYLTLSYELVILYEQKPVGTNVPKEERVIGIFLICIPNGLLHQKYNNDVFSPGKTAKLTVKKNQVIQFGSNTYETQGNETIECIKEVFNNNGADYLEYVKRTPLKWNVDARFNYTSITFKCLNEGSDKRIVKLFLNQKRFKYFFYHVEKNKYNKEEIKRQPNTIEGYNELINLPIT